MNSIIVTPHDRIFKASLKNIKVAREYFEKYLPEKALKAINLNVLEPCPEIYVNQYLELSESDMVYKTQISGETGYICLAAEHQSTDEVFMPFRMLKYDVAIWQFHKDQNPKSKKLPLIINLVFYSGKKPYQNSTDFKDLLNAPKELVEAFWATPFTLIQAQNIPDDQLLLQKYAGIFMYFMKYIHEPDFLPYLKVVLPLLKAIDEENGVQYIEALNNYALTAGEFSSTEDYVKLLKNALSKTTGEKVMTGAEQLIEIGALKGERTLLKRQLVRRFGSVPSSYLEKVENADADRLLKIGDKIIEATNLDDVFKNYH